jgi:hypothetical protein
MGLGQANELLLALYPAPRARGFEELRLVADRILVNLERVLVRTNENGDEVVEVLDVAGDPSVLLFTSING